MKTDAESRTRSKRTSVARQARKVEVSDGVSGGYDCPREQMIAEAAYFRAERRGFVPGHEMSDWLQAESDVEGLLGRVH